MSTPTSCVVETAQTMKGPERVKLKKATEEIGLPKGPYRLIEISLK